MVNDFLRCPGCGHVHQIKKGVLPSQISDLHEFQVLVRRTGPDTRAVRGRIEWGARPITRDELEALKDAFEKIVDRLDDAIKEIE
jgi:HAMP domain-containing protein